ncbi:hypothetical protein WJX75_005906 [Coccomyxa subellipsoidea]|uniref:Exostosin GT47 domain-containing protein n=1 Tax=Coccomyxa subellipsoidea TaxID=248742 RepID=A0ABR2YL04_9CHLO
MSDPVFGMPPCVPEQKIVADDKGQIITCTKPPCEQRGSHNISHFAGPYWLQHYLKSSKYYTSDISSADAVLVYDYCYVQWMIGDVHSNERLFPHLDVYKGYQRLSRLRRFGKHEGEDFVFFEPHPLSGIYSQFCKDYSRSLHLVVEAPIRYYCPADEGRRSFLVVPYSSPEFVDDGDVAEVERDIDVFFQGHCSDHMLALAVRKYAVEYLDGLKLPSVQAGCDKSNSHKELRGTLRRSKFCLVIAGETASTRRLTDVMLAGCIPVFLGPPWHSLPLAQWVNYSSFAIFLELAAIREVKMETPAVALLEPKPGKTAKSVYDHSWWILDADVSSHFRTIANISELLPLLKAMPAEEVARKQANVEKYKGPRALPSSKKNPILSFFQGLFRGSSTA